MLEHLGKLFVLGLIEIILLEVISNDLINASKNQTNRDNQQERSALKQKSPETIRQEA